VDETATWVGRATPRPPADPWPTAEQPIVETGGQSVVYVEVPRRRGGALLVVVLVLVALLLGGAAGLMVNPGLRTALGMGPQPSPVSASASPTPPPPPPPPGLGDPVRDGAFEFVVKSVECGHSTVGEGLLTMRAKGQYCLVSVSVSNVGTIAGLLLDSAQRAYTAEGERRTADSGAGVLANRGITVWVNLIEPGKSVTGLLVFDIPKGASIARLELHDSALSDGAIVTL